MEYKIVFRVLFGIYENCNFFPVLLFSVLPQ
jgi:hypothetical protein